MTQKDYVALANELGNALATMRTMDENVPPTQRKGTYRDSGFGWALGAVMATLEKDNPKFDKGIFKAAIEFKATTGKNVTVGQRNFTVG